MDGRTTSKPVVEGLEEVELVVNVGDALRHLLPLPHVVHQEVVLPLTKHF